MCVTSGVVASPIHLPSEGGVLPALASWTRRRRRTTVPSGTPYNLYRNRFFPLLMIMILKLEIIPTCIVSIVLRVSC